MFSYYLIGSIIGCVVYFCLAILNKGGGLLFWLAIIVFWLYFFSVILCVMAVVSVLAMTPPF
jgi:hypothetical protein